MDIKDLTEDEINVLELLDKEPKHLDELGAHASTVLLKLEMKKSGEGITG